MTMKLDSTPLSEITHQAITLLTRELGAAKTLRFLNQFTAGFGNYTEERRELFRDLTLEDALGEIKAARED